MALNILCEKSQCVSCTDKMLLHSNEGNTSDNLMDIVTKLAIKSWTCIIFIFWCSQIEVLMCVLLLSVNIIQTFVLMLDSYNTSGWLKYSEGAIDNFILWFLIQLYQSKKESDKSCSVQRQATILIHSSFMHDALQYAKAVLRVPQRKQIFVKSCLPHLTKTEIGNSFVC